MTDVGNAVRRALVTGQCFATARKERSGLEATITTGLVLALTYLSVWTANTLQAYAEQPKPTPHVARWSLPPIDKCPESIKLWECIRHAEYSKNE